MRQSEIIIVGGGLAGLFCALKLAPLPVTVLAAAPLGEGASSAWAQGGVAAAVLENDSPELHAADTKAAGAGIVDEAVALSVAREARARIDDLLRFGAPFDRDAAGQLTPSQEAAHSARRIVRVKGDGAGAAIMASLIFRARATPSITICENMTVEDLIVQKGRVAGVFACDGEGRPQALTARAVVLATGGVGALFALTTNPPQASGVALACAARAGARIADAEFVQFHPTAIDIGVDPAPLATEALRGDGAILVDRAGRRFMPALHRDAELAPRDIVARGVFAEIAAGRGAFLDASAAIGAAFDEKFPNVAATCRGAGIDPTCEKIPVAPAEHYHMGGVAVDARGRSSLPGLWVAGEAASTGLHGANRLASNSLLEAVVFGDRVASDIAAALPDLPAPAPALAENHGAAPADAKSVELLREVMTRHVGVLRDQAGLAEALKFILALREKALAEGSADLRNRAEAALLIAASAYVRRESRGGHFRTDFPKPDAAQARRSSITLADAEQIARGVAASEAA